ncbi:MAG: DNA repair protein RecO [Phycisphaeraceae bacterium]
MPTLKDNAICLRLYDWSETSQVAVLLTEQHGKVRVTAKGSKRSTPSTMLKFSGGLELLTRGEAVMILKHGAELGNLTEWDVREGYWGLRKNLRGLELAMYGVDLAHHLLDDQDPHPMSFAALAELLSALAGGEEAGGTERALLRFQWTMIEDAGYRPTLAPAPGSGSGSGNENGNGPVLFSAREGGLVTGASDAWKVRRETVEVLRGVAGEAGNADPQAADVGAVVRANRLLCAYLRTILDKQLPTMGAVLGDQ